MKWLRKHTKQIMVGVVMFAMFSFVGGSALDAMLRPTPDVRPLGTVFGETLSDADLNDVRADYLILDRLFTRPDRPWVATMIHPSVMPEHYYLLTREAEEAGIVLPDEHVDSWMRRSGITPEWLAQFKQQRLFSYPVVRNAIRRMLAVQQLGRRVINASLPSEAQVRHYVRDTEEKVRVSLVALDASKFIESDEVLSEADMQAQFDKYKDESPGESDSGFGYKHPQRVRVQYFGGQVDRLAPQIEVTLDEIKQYWRGNKSQYRTVEFVDPPAPASQPTSQAAAAAPPPKQRVEREMRFSEAKPRVEREVRRRKASQRLERAMRQAAFELLQPWQGQSVDPKTGYKERIPEAVKAAGYMQAVSQRVSREFGINLVYAETPLVSAEELRLRPGIGAAAMSVSATERLRFADYAFRVPAFFEKEPGSETVPSLQLFQTPDSPLLTSTRQYIGGAVEIVMTGAYLCRVIEAQDATTPTALAEVRTQVAADVRLLRAFEGLEPSAVELLALARHIGLSEAWKLTETLRQTNRTPRPVSPPAFARRTPYLLGIPIIPGIGAESEDFVDACFALASDDWTASGTLDVTTDLFGRVTTQPAADPAPRVMLARLPKHKKWAVVEFLGLNPIYQDAYENQHRAVAAGVLRSLRGQEINKAWFEASRIEARCGFKRIESGRQSSPPEGATADG